MQSIPFQAQSPPSEARHYLVLIMVTRSEWRPSKPCTFDGDPPYDKILTLVVDMYIKDLELDHFRCFKKGSVSFTYPGNNVSADLPNINLLLGNNATGKTTVLRAIALAVLSRTLLKSGLRPQNLIRRDSSNRNMAQVSATVLLHTQDTRDPQEQLTGAAFVREGDYESLLASSNTKVTAENPTWESLFHHNSPGFFVLGYGASRWVPTSQRQIDSRFMGNEPLPRYERVMGLFEGHTGLTPLGTWLPQIQSTERGHEVIAIINQLLPEDTTMTTIMANRNYCFEQAGTRVAFPDLSDGYRAYIGWIADLLFHLQSICPDDQALTSLKGIVLIDEVDLHLHPSWQRNILPAISKAFPNLQFVMSSHSPIVAGTLASENIIFLDAPQGKPSQISRLNENIRGLNAEQILLSSFFNLETSRAPGADEQLHELASRAMTGDEQASQEYMALLIRGQNTEETKAQAS